jgi:hypothetical protein
MPGFFRRFFLGDKGPPPPPDVEHLPSFADQRIVETIYSDSKSRRVFITIDDTGDYRIHSEWWDISDWKEWGKAFWYGHNTGSHTDNLERARELAREAIGDLHDAT